MMMLLAIVYGILLACKFISHLTPCSAQAGRCHLWLSLLLFYLHSAPSSHLPDSSLDLGWCDPVGLEKFKCRCHLDPTCFTFMSWSVFSLTTAVWIYRSLTGNFPDHVTSLIYFLVCVLSSTQHLLSVPLCQALLALELQMLVFKAFLFSWGKDVHTNNWDWSGWYTRETQDVVRA